MVLNQETDKLENAGNMKNINTVPLAYYESHQDDEINLLDLWLVLTKRKFLFLCVLIVCSLLGLSYALSQPNVYDFSTSIEIGSKLEDRRFVQIETAASVLDKINRVYIPLALSNDLKTSPENQVKPEITASIGKGSSIVSLNIKGQEDHQMMYFALLNSVTTSIKKDHQRISLVERKDVELEKNKISDQVFKIKEQGGLLHAQNKRLNEKSRLLEKRIKNLKKLIADSEQTKQEAMRKSNTEGKALALMMIDNDLRQANMMLAEMEEEFYIAINNDRDVIANKITDNIRLQAEAKNQLAKFEIRLANLLETRAVLEPMKSIKTTGKSKKLIVLVSIFAGFFLALFSVFVFEFLEKARNYAADKSQSID